jgi:hypothetical protein
MKTLLRIFCLLVPVSAAQAKDLPPTSFEEMWRVIQAQQAQIDDLRRDNASMRERLEGTMGPVLEETLVESEDRKIPAAATMAEPGATSLQIYGKVQLDAIYDFDRVDPDWKDSSRPSKIPVQDPAVFGSDGEAILSSRQTTLGMRSEDDTPLGRMKTWVEWDLYAMGNDAGELELNTKHLWLEWENWGVGQTNTNFMDGNIFPNTIDYWGPPGMIYVRKPQIRYTHWVGAGGSHWSVSLEDPSSDVDAGDVREIDPDLAEALQPRDSMPDLTLRWRGMHEWGHYQLAGIARKLDVETKSDGLGGNPNNTPKEDTFGWGLNFTSVINTFEMDQLKLGIVYGEGIASYFNDGGTAIGLERGGLDPVESLGLTLWYDHYWTPRWSTSVGWGMHQQDNTELQSDDAFDTGQLAQINLLYTQGNFLTGVEAIWMEREDNNGEDNDAFRLQYSVKYSFDKGL